jgi:hypothetical protein
VKPNRPKWIWGMIAGGLLMLASPLFVYWRQTAGLQGGAGVIEATYRDGTPANPLELSRHIDLALHGTAIGIAGFVAGLVVFGVSLRGYRRVEGGAAKGTPDNAGNK